MQKIFLRLLIGLFSLAIVYNSIAVAASINLNDFYADDFVVIDINGSSALIEENSALVHVLLFNDPSLGDPILPFPSNTFQLSFDYEFTIAGENWDEFYVKSFDPFTGIKTEELSIEYDNSFGTSPWVHSATIAWNIVGGAPSSGLGLEFQLSTWDFCTGSSVLISDVKFEPVPEPSTFILLGLGLFCLIKLTQDRKTAGLMR
jgi:hypothetical protein